MMMTAPSDSKWNELQPALFADRDHPVLRAARGTLILVRLNRVSHNDDLLSSEIMAGTLVRANRSEGFVLSRVGANAGEEFCLPLVPAAFNLQPPGQYRLSCGTIVTDPVFLAAFDISAPLS